MANQGSSRFRGPDSYTPSESQVMSYSQIWEIMDELTVARKEFDLLPQTLAVLRALISFLPKDGSSTLVWPSNATLCERACGLSERSLRRHIVRLISAGLVARKASSNGKRFALRFRQKVVDAFGFDLSGLFTLAPSIKEKAQAELDRQERIKALKTMLRQKIYQSDDPNAISLLKCLRHKDNLEELESLFVALEHSLPLLETANLTATDRRNDLHIQNTKKESLCKKERLEQQSLSFDDCIKAIEESLVFAETPVKSWKDLIHFGYAMAPMIGVSQNLYEKARQEMGEIPSALTVICLSQKLDKITKPAAYLNRLVQKAMDGTFSLSGLLNSSKGHKAARMH